jgi:hypothetical protein
MIGGYRAKTRIIYFLFLIVAFLNFYQVSQLFFSSLPPSLFSFWPSLLSAFFLSFFVLIESQCVAQIGLKLNILLSQPPKCWDNRPVIPPCPPLAASFMCCLFSISYAHNSYWPWITIFFKAFWMRPGNRKSFKTSGCLGRIMKISYTIFLNVLSFRIFHEVLCDEI